MWLLVSQDLQRDEDTVFFNFQSEFVRKRYNLKIAPATSALV